MSMQAFYTRLHTATPEPETGWAALACLSRCSLAQLLKLSANLWWDPWGAEPA